MSDPRDDPYAGEYLRSFDKLMGLKVLCAHNLSHDRSSAVSASPRPHKCMKCHDLRRRDRRLLAAIDGRWQLGVEYFSKAMAKEFCDENVQFWREATVWTAPPSVFKPSSATRS